MKGLRVGITGSPATGKKTLGRALAGALKVPFLTLNDIAAEAGFLIASRGAEPKLDARGFRRVAARYLPDGGFVISGVFLAEAVPSRLLDYVVVLRCNPLVLSERYDERGYSQRKRKENLTAEFLDACLGGALEAFGDKTREVDTSGKNLSAVLRETRASLRSGRASLSNVDWLGLVKGPEDVFRFMI